MLALARYESQVHDGCGLHDSVARTNPETSLEFDTCPMCASLAKALRQLAAEDDKRIAALGKKPAPDADYPADGRRISLRRVDGPS